MRKLEILLHHYNELHSLSMLNEMNVIELIDDYDEIIHYDARKGYTKTLEVYLKYKLECINKLYQYGESKWTVLLAACYYQHETIVQMLIIQFKSNVEAEGTIRLEDFTGSPQIIECVSPLYAAATVDNIDIVKFLVEYGLANMNHLTKEHSTPLRPACYNRNFEMVQFLIRHEAIPHQSKLQNKTNLMLVICCGYTDLVMYFVDEIKCDINQQDEDGQTALHCAIEYGSITITKFLISQS